MLKKFFNKKYTVETFKELLHKKPPELKEIRKALENDIDINFIDEKGDSFLHYTINKGLTTCSKFLIEQGIDLNVKDKNNCTAIYLSIVKSNKNVVESILSTNKININQLYSNRTLLQDAILQGSREIVNMLLKTNIDKNHIDNQGRSIIFDAIANGNEKLIDTILEVEGLEFNAIDKDNKTILHQKNIIEDDQLALKLIKKGADPTILDGDGKSYLLYIALRGMETEEIIDAAIEAGFSINSTVRNKNSILMEIMFSFEKLSEAESNRRDDLMAMATKLVKKGLDVNALNNKGETVLFDAVRRLDLEACVFLINEDIDINVINHNGDSVLSEIIYQGIKALDIIYLLLKHGADVSIKNTDGQTLIEVVNDLVLYTHGNITLEQNIVDKLIPNAQYLRLLKEILLNTSFDASYISSTGEPLFFKSLLTGNRPLFDLYYKFKININAIDQNKETIFARYVDMVGHMQTTPEDFRQNLLMLINRKVNINLQDNNGKTILAKLITNNNMKMFRELFAATRFNYSIRDNMGRSIIYDCVVTSNVTALKLIDQIVPKLKNIPDNFGILPITYAALFGNIKLVLVLMNLEAHYTSNRAISTIAKNKFLPLLKNLDKLECEDKDELHKLEVLKDQIRRDFQ